MFLNKEEVFMSYEMERYVKAKEALDKGRIEYKTKIQQNSGYSPMSHRMGHFGEKTEYNSIYYIYTNKEVADQARYLIQESMK